MTTASKRRAGAFLGAGLFLSLILAAVVSNFASASPDGLDSTMLQGCEVVDDQIVGGSCPAQQAQDDQLAGSPFAGYSFAGIENPWVATLVAGGTGVLVTFAIGAGLFWLARRRTPGTQPSTEKESVGA